jgi:hypothetical protein
MRFSIATALCLLSTHVFAEQMLLRCHGYSLGIGDTSKQPFIFTVTIDRDRSLVVDVDADDGGATPNTSNGSIVETIEFSETTISANQHLWRRREKDLAATPACGRNGSRSAV